MMKSETMSMKEAAARLGVDLQTVRRAIKRGELPASRLGRRVLVIRSAVEAKLNPAVLAAKAANN